MNLYRVRVDCVKQGLCHVRAVRRTFILSARDTSHALEQGRYHAEMVSPGWQRWIEIVAREAARIELPLEIAA